MNIGPFEVQTAPLERFAPYTRYTVKFAGQVLGMQVSHPSVEDCLTWARRAYELHAIDHETITRIRRLAGDAPALRLPTPQPSARKAPNQARHVASRSPDRPCTKCGRSDVEFGHTVHGTRRSWCLDCERAAARAHWRAKHARGGKTS